VKVENKKVEEEKVVEREEKKVGELFNSVTCRTGC